MRICPVRTHSRATELVTAERVAQQIACGPAVDEHVKQVRQFDAGFDEIALVQIGGELKARFLPGRRMSY